MGYIGKQVFERLAVSMCEMHRITWEQIEKKLYFKLQKLVSDFRIRTAIHFQINDPRIYIKNDQN